MPYAVFDDHFDEHPKVVRAGGDAGWLHFCAVLYCRRNLTGGVFPKVLVPRLSDRKKPVQLAQRLVDERLWEDEGEVFRIHDYTDLYEREDQERERRRTKAKKAADKRWGNAQANAQASDSGCSDDARPMPSPSPSPSPLRSELSPLLLTGVVKSLNGETGDGSSLRERLEMVCTGESVKRRRQAPRVLELCQRHVSDDMIDEAIGYMASLRKPPEYPVYLLRVISQWGPQRGVDVPDLPAQWEREKSKATA